MRSQPIVRYGFSNELISEMANDASKPVEMKRCAPEPGELDGQNVTALRHDLS